MTDKVHDVHQKTMQEVPLRGRMLELSRRRVLKATAASAAALALAWDPGEVRADVSGAVNVYAGSGKRWDGSMRTIAPLFQKKFPNTTINFTADPIGEIYTKIPVMMNSKVDTFNVIYTDFGQWPQHYSTGSMVPLQSYADSDPEWAEDYFTDVPSAIWRLYRIPATVDGELYGFCPDGNAMMQFYRKDVFDAKGIKVPETWPEAIEAAKEVHNPPDQYGYCAAMGRGIWAGFEFYAALLSFGGQWFDKLEPGFFNPDFASDAGYNALRVLLELDKYAHPVTRNAGEDEVNTAFANGSALYGPLTWGTANLNNPDFSNFPDEWHTALAPRGDTPEGVHRPLMGGLGQFLCSWASDHDAAWEWVKFLNSGDKTDPEIGRLLVEAGGQPSRISLLDKYEPIRNFFTGLKQSVPVAVPYVPPIPEANSLVQGIGEEAADVLNGEKDIEEGLKAMDKRVRRVMEDSGYYD